MCKETVIDILRRGVAVIVEHDMHKLSTQAVEVWDFGEQVERQLVAHASQVVGVLIQLQCTLIAP